MNERFKAFDFFHLRLPSLSFEKITGINSSSSIEELGGKLHHLYQSLALQDAIYLASPELHSLLVKWLNAPVIGDIDPKLLMTLYKYAVRMGTRSTPFGLFAGVSLGSIQQKPSSIKISDKNRVHRRLDMDYTTDIAIQIANNEEIKDKLHFHSNSSLYKTPDGYRFYECQHEADKRNYFLTSIQSSVYIDMVIEMAKTGIKYSEIIKKLEQEDIPNDLATTFVDNLINDQILISELEPTVTGIEFQNILLDKLTVLDTKNQYLTKLKEIDSLCKKNDSIINISKSITNIIAEFFPQDNRKNLLQVDLKINTLENQINEQVINIISKELSELAPLNQVPTSEDLTSFKKRFSERYEDQEIPLLEAIDADLGIGYGTTSSDFNSDNPLIKKLTPRSSNSENKLSASIQKLLLDKLIRSIEKGVNEVELTTADLKNLVKEQETENKFPSTAYAMGSLITESGSAMDEGDFSFNLSGFSGPSAVPIMARFGHLEPQLALKLSECVAYEEADELILAEIVHLPESRVGNILQRPNIRKHEIPFLGKSNQLAEHQIPVADIMVSIKNGKIVLRSKKLGLEIRPRLSCAHNYHHGISLYRFLSDLQDEHQSLAIKWDWLDLDDRQFLPRIWYKHLILSRAKWTIQSSALKEYKNLITKQDREQFLKDYRLPNQVMLSEGDNELLIDFSSIFGFDIFIVKLKKYKVTLFESLLSDIASLVNDTEGLSYSNELIIPLKYDKQPESSLINGAKEAFPIKRSFSLGSEWVYAKIYCGIKQTDRVLTESILPLIESLEEEQVIAKWFFIRYNDPENHIRIRFLIKDALEKNLNEVLKALNQELKPLFDAGIIYRIQYDTYNREIERYGGRSMEISESIFCIDSHAVVRLLKEKKSERWQYAVYGVDQLLKEFDLDLQEKLVFVSTLRDAFFNEFNGDKDLNYQLNTGYREHVNALDAFFEEQINSNHNEFDSPFDERSLLLKEAYAELKDLLKEDQDVKQETIRLLESYCHMFINRIFYVDQRLNELVVYHYLMKYYNTLIGKRKSLQLV